MSSIWMRHPDLPETQLIQVEALAVPHHQAAGWETAEAPAAAPRPPLTPQAAAAEPAPEQPPADTAAELPGEEAAPEATEDTAAEPAEPSPAPTSKRRAAAKESEQK